jgi:branched-chain amino acid transport system ATP-binding protein
MQSQKDHTVLLRVENLVKRFGGVKAMNHVSLSVQAGMIKSIIGPNGAGKTTLFNLISGVLQPDSGRVLLDGERLSGTRPYRIARRGVSRTFQTMLPFYNMTVLENVMVGRHIRSSAGLLRAAVRTLGARREEKNIWEEARKWLDFVGLTPMAGDPAGSLPCGRMKLLEIARALATEPRLLLLDEPAAGLNIMETEKLAVLLLKIKRLGITQILVEHDMSLVMDVSDEVFVLDSGTPVAEGPPEEIQKNPEVIRIYLGETETADAPGA